MVLESTLLCLAKHRQMCGGQKVSVCHVSQARPLVMDLSELPNGQQASLDQANTLRRMGQCRLLVLLPLNALLLCGLVACTPGEVYEAGPISPQLTIPDTGACASWAGIECPLFNEPWSVHFDKRPLQASRLPPPANSDGATEIIQSVRLMMSQTQSKSSPTQQPQRS